MGNCVGRAGRRVDTSASGGRLESSSVVHVVCVFGGWGGCMSRQLEHMAGCQQHRDLRLLLLTASPPVLFIFLPFTGFVEGREQVGGENENRDDLNTLHTSGFDQRWSSIVLFFQYSQWMALRCLWVCSRLTCIYSLNSEICCICTQVLKTGISDEYRHFIRL